MHEDVKVLGIHHVTAMVSDPQKNVDFYAGVLGLRLVKKTVNFDAPDVYHLYYGDETGQPGTVFTVFPFLAGGRKGRKGSGQVTVTAFSAPLASSDYWMERLNKNDVEVRLEDRFGERVIAFLDPDDLGIEIIFSDKDSRRGWEEGPIPEAHALRGFHSVTLSVNGYENTARLMTNILGFRKTAEHMNRFRFEMAAGGAGCTADILCQPDLIAGTMGPGTVHHVAWQIADDTAQDLMRKKLRTAGVNVTPVVDRSYFHSIYFPSPGGILFEVATNSPGFLIDESIGKLGTRLRLPPWLEGQRETIETALPEIVRPDKERV